MFEDDPRHDALGSRLHGGRRHPLLRRKHAGSGGADLDIRPYELDAALRPRARQQGRQDAPAEENPHLAEGVNTYGGKLTYRAVAEAQGKSYTPLKQALA